jgi:hypothetical protein
VCVMEGNTVKCVCDGVKDCKKSVRV